MYSSSVGQQALLLYVSCSALLVAHVPALLRGPKPALLLGFSLVVLANETWEITDHPHGCKPIRCKWVFKKKLRPDDIIKKYKARLVAKRYTQKEGEDFFNTYSPMAWLTTIRVLLLLAASHGLLVHQMDVKTTFLNGELEEEIYMEQPDGFVVDGQEGKVCKLLKSLYESSKHPNSGMRSLKEL